MILPGACIIKLYRSIITAGFQYTNTSPHIHKLFLLTYNQLTNCGNYGSVKFYDTGPGRKALASKLIE